MNSAGIYRKKIVCGALLTVCLFFVLGCNSVGSARKRPEWTRRAFYLGDQGLLYGVGYGKGETVESSRSAAVSKARSVLWNGIRQDKSMQFPAVPGNAEQKESFRGLRVTYRNNRPVDYVELRGTLSDITVVKEYLDNEGVFFVLCSCTGVEMEPIPAQDDYRGPALPSGAPEWVGRRFYLGDNGLMYTTGYSQSRSPDMAFTQAATRARGGISRAISKILEDNEKAEFPPVPADARANLSFSGSYISIRQTGNSIEEREVKIQGRAADVTIVEEWADAEGGLYVLCSFTGVEIVRGDN